MLLFDTKKFSLFYIVLKMKDKILCFSAFIIWLTTEYILVRQISSLQAAYTQYTMKEKPYIRQDC